MIGGTDVAGRTLDPGDIVAFVGGGLRDQFVSDEAHLERRLTDLDDARDPDGRFRVNEFLCHDDTWQGTLESLLLRSEVVLMDLRGFSQRTAAACTSWASSLSTGGSSARCSWWDGTHRRRARCAPR